MNSLRASFPVQSLMSLLILLMTSSALVFAQLPEQKNSGVVSSVAVTALTGRVINDEGQPIPFARIVISAPRLNGLSTKADAEGNFRIDDLPPADYSVNAAAEGYLPESVAGRMTTPPGKFRPGDSVTIRLIKGGVITGRVSNEHDDPIVALRVRVIQVRDASGRKLSPGRDMREVMTDDRGVFRSFGLTPGAYLVAAGVRQLRDQADFTYTGNVLIYHPASARENAAEVEVRLGEEMSGIDIRYRHERGHTLSGTLSGPAEFLKRNQGAGIALMWAAGQGLAGNAWVTEDSDGAWKIEGIADGEYLITARSDGTAEQPGLYSIPRRITINGSDLRGIALNMVPLSAIAGRVVIEKQNAPQECATPHPIELQRTSLTALGADQKIPEEVLRITGAGYGHATSNAEGAFLINSLIAGQYRLLPAPPEPTLYLRSVTQTPDATNSQSQKAAIDALRFPISVKAGERVSGIIVTFATGAASVSGRLVSEGKPPERISITLVPAEREAADDLRRYPETLLRHDGTFLLRHIPPGKYRIIASWNEEENRDALRRPTAWDHNERARLRREAAASNIVIELQPCQRVTDYELKYVPRQ